MKIQPPSLSFTQFNVIAHALCYHFYGFTADPRKTFAFLHYHWTEGFTPEQAAEELNRRSDAESDKEMRDPQ